MRNLPAALNAPRLATDINASTYHVKGRVGEMEATATLDQSTMEGATIGTGTTAEFGLAGKDIRYAARGSVRGLDLSRIGTAFDIDALAKKPDYQSAINAEFDAQGRGTSLADTTLDATATVSDSRVLGGVVPRLAADVHLDRGSLRWKANGEFREFDPAHVAGNDALKGTVNGTVDASFGIQDLSAPITPDSISADGRVTLTGSELAGLTIEAADVDGQYAARRGTLRKATVKGPNIEVTGIRTDCARQHGQHEPEVPRRRDGYRTDWEAIQPGGQRLRDGRRHDHRERDEPADDRNRQRIESRVSGEQGSRHQQHVHGHAARSRRQSCARAGADQRDLPSSGRPAHQRVAGRDHLRRAEARFQAHVAQGPESAAEAAVSPQGPGVRELDAGGTVIFHPDHQEIHLPRFAVRTQGVEWTMAPGSEAAVQYSKDRVELQNVRLVNGTQSLDLTGVLAVGNSANAPSAITVRAANVDLAQIDKLLLQSRGFTGTLNAEARITGDPKSPAVDGHAEVSNGGFQRFTYQSLTVTANYAPAEAAGKSERIVLDAKLTQSPGAELRVNGTVPMTALRRNPPGVTGHIEGRAGDELDLSVQSSLINLGILQGFTKQLTNVTGTRAGATCASPASGEDPASERQRGHSRRSVHGPGGEDRVQRPDDEDRPCSTDVIRMPQLPDPRPARQAADDRPASWRCTSARRGAVNIAIDSDDFKLMDNELGNIHVGTHLKVTGELRRPRIEGDVRTDAARLEIDKILQAIASPYSEEALPDVVTAQPTRETNSQGCG